jgi:hypothetical protein
VRRVRIVPTEASPSSPTSAHPEAPIPE